ncbi:MAG: pyridoxal-dependent decarboxylase [Bryobacteraceae bacterium]
MHNSESLLVASALSKSPWFSSLTSDELNELASLAALQRLGPDTVVFREGDPGDALFVVVTGQVRISVATTSGEVTLNTLGPGDIFGEIAVLDGRGRTATVTTTKATELVKIGRMEFLAFLAEFPRYATVLVRILASRVRSTVQVFPDVNGLTATASDGDGPSKSGVHTLPRNGASPVQHYDDWTEMPETGFSAAITYQHIHEKLQLEGLPHLNVASFVTTWMETEAEQLAHESINKNLVNVAEYAHTESIHRQVIAMTANLFHADVPAFDPSSGKEAPIIGATTVGSSEAVMLALLAHKWNWRHKSPRSPKDRPYVVFGTHTHACFAKFGRYFDVEVRWVPLEPGRYAVTAEQIRAIVERRIVDDPEVMQACGYTAEEAGDRRVGELVMAVACVVGTTYTGDIDDVAGINRVLAEGGWDIPVHVDAASGGFILPFTEDERTGAPLEWDFRLPKVCSINVSNHKYGLVYPGLGTLVFRNPSILPEELLVDIDYLSGEMRNFSLNFSRASNSVILQYFNFLRLGKAGYRRIIQGCLDRARDLAKAIRASPTLDPFVEVVSRTEYLPIVALKLRDKWLAEPPFTLDEIAKRLEATGWFAPVYSLPPDNEQIQVMRIVVRAHFSPPLVDALVRDLEIAVQEFSLQAHV